MAPLGAGAVASRRHLLAPEAWRVGSQIDWQAIGVENFVAVKARERHLGGGDKPVVVLDITVHRVGVLRQMAGAGGGCRTDHQRGVRFLIAFVPRFSGELSVVKGPREPRAGARP